MMRRLLPWMILLACWPATIATVLGAQWARFHGPPWLVANDAYAIFGAMVVVLTGLAAATFVCAAVLADRWSD